VSKGYIVDEMHRYNIILETREIFLHGHDHGGSDGDPGVEYRMSNCLLKNMRLLEQTADKPIFIHQHSIGGEWIDAMLMYDIIKNCSQQVIVIAHGAACSAGSVVPLAADLVVSMPHCYWMIHKGTTGVNTDMRYSQAKSTMEYEESQNKIMLDIYTETCANGTFFKGKSKKYIKSYIEREMSKKEDLWFSAERAVEMGFCSGIYGQPDFENLEAIVRHVY